MSISQRLYSLVFSNIIASKKMEEESLAPRAPRYTRKGTPRFMRIRWCILLTGLSLFAQLYVYQPLIDELHVSFGILPSTASLSVSSGTIGMAIGLFIYVFYADVLPRRRLMVYSMAVSAVLTTISIFAASFWFLVTLCLLKGVALSGISAVALAYLAEEIDPSCIGEAISVYLAGNTLGGMSGRVVSGLIAGWFNWRVSTAVIAGVAIVLAIIFWALFPNSHNFTPKNIPISVRLRRMRLFLSTPYFLSLYLTGCIAMGVFVSVYNYLSFVLTNDYHLPHYIVASIFLMYTVGILGSVWFGKASDRRSSRWLLRLSLGGYALGMVLMAVPSLAVVIVGLFLMTLSFFGVHMMASRMVSTKAKEGKSSATCLYWLFYYFGSSSMGYLMGLVYFAYGWMAFIGVNVLLLGIAAAVSGHFIQPRYVPGESFRVPS